MGRSSLCAVLRSCHLFITSSCYSACTNIRLDMLMALYLTGWSLPPLPPKVIQPWMNATPQLWWQVECLCRETEQNLHSYLAKQFPKPCFSCNIGSNIASVLQEDFLLDVALWPLIHITHFLHDVHTPNGMTNLQTHVLTQLHRLGQRE